MAVRSAMGAGRARLIRQLLTESLLLAVAGGALGVLVSHVGLDAILAISPNRAYSGLEYIAVDWTALWFAFGLSCLTGVAFGLAPAWSGSKTNLSEVIKDAGPGASLSKKGQRGRTVMMISEIALTSILLVGAGLMIRNLWNATRLDLGYDPNVLTASSQVPRAGDGQAAEWQPAARQFARAAVERLRAVPGATEVGAAWPAYWRFAVQPAEGSGVDGARTDVINRGVSVDFFAALSIPLRRGRLFDSGDRAGSAPVAILSESAARTLFGDADPLGQYVAAIREPESTEPPESWQIVGVVGDVRQSPIPDDADTAELYRPLEQLPTGSPFFFVKAQGDPNALASAVGQELQALNPNEPVYGLRTQERALLDQVRSRAMMPAIIITFSVLALVLALVGIYGVTAYSMARRTREMGIRMALGAERGDLVRSMGAQAVWATGIGLALGAAGSAVLARGLLSRLDPRELAALSLTSVHFATGVGALLLLGAVSLGAAYWPVRKAAKIHPMEALRYE